MEFKQDDDDRVTMWFDVTASYNKSRNQFSVALPKKIAEVLGLRSDDEKNRKGDLGESDKRKVRFGFNGTNLVVVTGEVEEE